MVGKKNIIYIIMIVAIVLTMIYRPEVPESDSAEPLQEDIPQELQNLKERVKLALNGTRSKFKEFRRSQYFFYVIVPSLLIIIASFIWNVKKGKATFVNEQVKKSIKQSKKLFAENVQNREEYDMITKETTKKEIEKLFENERFKTMVDERGENQENWNWQSREKSKKVVFREVGEGKSDTSDEHMSQVDFSDEEIEKTRQSN
jgi:hypothetical protein